jgi:hypothetical protein
VGVIWRLGQGKEKVDYGETATTGAHESRKLTKEIGRPRSEDALFWDDLRDHTTSTQKTPGPKRWQRVP